MFRASKIFRTAWEAWGSNPFQQAASRNVPVLVRLDLSCDSSRESHKLPASIADGKVVPVYVNVPETIEEEDALFLEKSKHPRNVFENCKADAARTLLGFCCFSSGIIFQEAVISTLFANVRTPQQDNAVWKRNEWVDVLMLPEGTPYLAVHSEVQNRDAIFRVAEKQWAEQHPQLRFRARTREYRDKPAVRQLLIDYKQKSTQDPMRSAEKRSAANALKLAERRRCPIEYLLDGMEYYLHAALPLSFRLGGTSESLRSRRETLATFTDAFLDFPLPKSPMESFVASCLAFRTMGAWWFHAHHEFVRVPPNHLVDATLEKASLGCNALLNELDAALPPEVERCGYLFWQLGIGIRAMWFLQTAAPEQCEKHNLSAKTTMMEATAQRLLDHLSRIDDVGKVIASATLDASQLWPETYMYASIKDASEAFVERCPRLTDLRQRIGNRVSFAVVGIPKQVHSTMLAAREADAAGPSAVFDCIQDMLDQETPGMAVHNTQQQQEQQHALRDSLAPRVKTNAVTNAADLPWSVLPWNDRFMWMARIAATCTDVRQCYCWYETPGLKLMIAKSRRGTLKADPEDEDDVDDLEGENQAAPDESRSTNEGKTKPDATLETAVSGEEDLTPAMLYARRCYAACEPFHKLLNSHATHLLTGASAAMLSHGSPRSRTYHRLEVEVTADLPPHFPSAMSFGPLLGNTMSYHQLGTKALIISFGGDPEHIPCDVAATSRVIFGFRTVLPSLRLLRMTLDESSEIDQGAKMCGLVMPCGKKCLKTTPLSAELLHLAVCQEAVQLVMEAAATTRKPLVVVVKNNELIGHSSLESVTALLMAIGANRKLE